MNRHWTSRQPTVEVGVTAGPVCAQVYRQRWPTSRASSTDPPKPHTHMNAPCPRQPPPSPDPPSSSV